MIWTRSDAPNNQQKIDIKRVQLLQRNIKLYYENLAKKLQKKWSQLMNRCNKSIDSCVCCHDQWISITKKFIDWFDLILCCCRGPVIFSSFFSDFLKLYTFRTFDLFKCICIGIIALCMWNEIDHKDLVIDVFVVCCCWFFFVLATAASIIA